MTTGFYHRFISRNSSGFTLIELLVVMSVIAIVSTVSIASFVTYSKSATVNQSSSDVAALLQDAKARTQAQVKPSSCAGSLDGYRVDICGLTGSVCSPNTANTYTLSMICSGTKTVLSTKKLPTSTAFVQNGTTAESYQFQVLTNGVNTTGDIVLGGYNLNATVTVGQSGSITVH